MADRKPHVGGNWKMNLNREQSIALAGALADRFDATSQVDVTILPPFVYLADVAKVLCEKNSGIMLGAQDFYFEKNGAFTGEISLDMLKDVGCKVLLAGHSERRHVLGESDTLINEKVLAGLEAGLHVILCVGETLEQREAGKTDAVNVAQTVAGLAGVKASQMKQITLAYEPVWAIGTGKTATPDDAQNAQKAIRAALASVLFDASVADAVRIQYGGSVKPDNAAELFAQQDVDGGLIGGASLKADDFVGILNAAQAVLQ